MKIGREELKALIKECIVEVLQDGVGGNLVEQVTPAPQRQAQPQHQQRRVTENRRRFDPSLDAPVKPPVSKQNPLLQEAIKYAAGGDNIMASILADTAMTTLQQQNSAPGAVEGARASASNTEQIVGTPEQVFGEEAAGTWADLAFKTPRPPPGSVPPPVG